MEQQKTKRTLTGQVVSTKMDKTIAVLIERRVEHPIYKKYMRKSTKLLAHDENGDCKEGDTVAIEECRPLSKRKAWRLQRVITRAAEF
ncbi:MAG: 30S ribosomal protein S17 [Gammaproteobacteria bacterium]|nr:30S ribosomal protein S17 [Gammaproteobacteria bacterium]